MNIDRVLFLGILKPFQCAKCDKSYKHRPNLIRHSKYECDGIPKFNCPLCIKVYTQNSTLRQHILALHPGYRFPGRRMPKFY